MINSEIIAAYSLTFVGTFVYLVRDLSKESKPKNPFVFIKNLVVALLVSAVMAIPLTGAIAGLIFGTYEH